MSLHTISIDDKAEPGLESILADVNAQRDDANLLPQTLEEWIADQIQSVGIHRIVMDNKAAALRDRLIAGKSLTQGDFQFLQTQVARKV